MPSDADIFQVEIRKNEKQVCKITLYDPVIDAIKDSQMSPGGAFRYVCSPPECVPIHLLGQIWNSIHLGEKSGRWAGFQWFLTK